MRRRDDSSRSRSRSPKKIPRYYHDNSSSQRQASRKPIYHSREPQTRTKFNLKSKSHFKNHVEYDDIRVFNRKEAASIREYVRENIEAKWGKVEQVNDMSKDENTLSFGIGFKYDEDAYHFINDGSHFKIEGKKIKGYPTPPFQHFMPVIKQALRQKRLKERSPSPVRRSNRYSPQKPEQINKRRRSASSGRNSRDSYNNKHKQHRDSHHRRQEKALWLFGLPWNVKGNQVGEFLERRHRSGSFKVYTWKWIRVKNSNCEFMEVILDAKKAEKLLKIRDELCIGDCPVIVTPADLDTNQGSIRRCLREFQFNIVFPSKIHPAVLYKSLSENGPVVQIVSSVALVDGCSESWTVTLSSADLAKDVRRLNIKDTGIRIEQTKGQLVYRPTKHSKLRDID